MFVIVQFHQFDLLDTECYPYSGQPSCSGHSRKILQPLEVLKLCVRVLPAVSHQPIAQKWRRIARVLYSCLFSFGYGLTGYCCKPRVQTIRFHVGYRFGGKRIPHPFVCSRIGSFISCAHACSPSTSSGVCKHPSMLRLQIGHHQSGSAQSTRSFDELMLVLLEKG
jgi:hypothetical protein